jgi:ribosomal protein S11
MLSRSNMTLIQVTDLKSKSTVTSSGHHGYGNFRAASVERAAGVLLARSGIGNRSVAAVD